MKYAPIALFAYNRPIHLKKTIDALKKNKYSKESEIHFFCDGSKNKKDVEKIDACKRIITATTGFKKKHLHFQEKNIGLAQSIIYGVSKLLSNHRCAIVVEDDILTHPLFLSNMNRCLELYEKNDKVFSVSGYNHPSSLLKIPSSYQYDVYFSHRASSWGWGTWVDRWQTVEWNTEKLLLQAKKNKQRIAAAGEDLLLQLKLQNKNKIDSWAVRFCISSALQEKFTVYPVKSLVNNIGMDGTGRHSGNTNRYQNTLKYPQEEFIFPSSLIFNKSINDSFLNIYKTPFKYKIFEFVKNILKIS